VRRKKEWKWKKQEHDKDGDRKPQAGLRTSATGQKKATQEAAKNLNPNQSVVDREEEARRR
jgi:hypothetical protein